MSTMSLLISESVVVSSLFQAFPLEVRQHAWSHTVLGAVSIVAEDIVRCPALHVCVCVWGGGGGGKGGGVTE